MCANDDLLRLALSRHPGALVERLRRLSDRELLAVIVGCRTLDWEARREAALRTALPRPAPQEER